MGGGGGCNGGSGGDNCRIASTGTDEFPQTVEVSLAMIVVRAREKPIPRNNLWLYHVNVTILIAVPRPKNDSRYPNFP